MVEAGEASAATPFVAGLAAVMARAGHPGAITAARRLSGGANMESWLFTCGGADFVLRRAPSAEWLAGRALDMAGEAAVIRAARAGGVIAPEVVVELVPEDNFGIGFIMACVPGTAEPEVVLASPATLADEIARAMARIHRLDPAGLDFLPVLTPAEGVERLAAQFAGAGGDRPVIALGLAWLRANLPAPGPLRVVHGDLRIGNVMAHEGHLSGVLDWELAHLGDPLEDLGWICTPSWRFGEIDRPVGGFGLREDLIAGHEALDGRPIDPERVKFWEVFGALQWGLMCAGMAAVFQSGDDPEVERGTIGRRASETEIDLLLYLAPQGLSRPSPSHAA